MQHAKQMRELEPVAMAWKEYEEITSVGGACSLRPRHC